MAFTVWQGNDPGNEGDINVAANYTNGVPTSVKGAYFTASSRAATKGLNRSADTWQFIVFGPGQTGPIGKSGEYLQVKCTDYITFDSSAPAYIDISGSAASLTSGVKVRSTSQAEFHLKVGTGASDLDTLIIQRGNYFHEAGNVGNLYM